MDCVIYCIKCPFKVSVALLNEMIVFYLYVTYYYFKVHPDNEASWCTLITLFHPLI